MDKRDIFNEKVLEIIKIKGFRAMTMRDIAQSMACDVSNIYNYTKSKDALLENLLFEISDKFHEGMNMIEKSHYLPAEKLKLIIGLHVRLTHEYPMQVQLLVNEWRNLKIEAQNRFLTFRSEYESKLQKILADGKDKDEFAIENLAFSKECVLAILRWPYTNNSQNYVETERLLVNFIFRALMVKV